MVYSDYFKLTDDLIQHLDPILVHLNDPFIESRYTGFLAVSAVTVYELSIKTIFQEFAQGKHKVRANFTNAYFDRINGRIKVAVIKDNYIKNYGEKYVKRFERKLEACERKNLLAQGASVRTCYANIITWRNSFAHEGQVPINATYDEVKKAYGLGKQVIHCLAESMKR